jgi:hypothetical protein
MMSVKNEDQAASEFKAAFSGSRGKSLDSSMIKETVPIENDSLNPFLQGPFGNEATDEGSSFFVASFAQ